MDLPEIQKILLSNTQPKPTQAPPEYLMEIGEYSQVLPRDYLGEARQMADSTAGIMSMAFPYKRLPLEKLKKLLDKEIFNYKREKYNFERGGPGEQPGAARAMEKHLKNIKEIEEVIKYKS
mgnify:CR=1 FL=1